MSRPFKREKAVALGTRMLFGLALPLFTSFAVAQNNLAELLDSGAIEISPGDFREQIVQRSVVGLAPTGARMEMMYANSGTIQGRAEVIGPAAAAGMGGLAFAPIDGVWNIDDSGKLCTSIVIGRTFLPFRCQHWFKLKDDYFVADSEDRSAKVLRRTVKQ